MVNNVVLIGRITKDPEVKMSNSGTSVCNFTVASNRNFKNQAGEYEADFINCVAFNQTAVFMGQYVGKGQLLSIQGRIQTRNYEDQTGKRVYVTEVVANNVNSLESRKSESAVSNSVPVSDNIPSFNPEEIDLSINDDDLPF